MTSPTAGHVEIETKYDLAPGDPLPDLVGVAGVVTVEVVPEQVLVAVYHDTEDLRLTAAATTLRRRTGGTDAGWHLKLPLGDGQRLEVHRPPGRDSSPVPRALASLVRAPVGSAALAPVATLTTTRRVLVLRDRAGATVAEVADDTVRAERHGEEPVLTTWREMEVELVEGSTEQLAALDEAVRAAGIEPAAGSSKVGRVLAAEVTHDPAPRLRRRSPLAAVLTHRLAGLVGALRAADPRVRAGVEGAPAELAAVVHDLIDTCVAYRHRFDPAGLDGVAALVDRLTELARVLDEAAATEVVATGLAEAVAGQPAELVLGPVTRTVDRHAAARRRETRAAATQALDTDAYVALLDDLDALAAAPPLVDPDARAGDALPAVVRRSLAKVRRRCTEIDPPADHLPPGLASAVGALRSAATSAVPVVGAKAADVVASADELAHLVAAYRATVLRRADLRLLAVRATGSGGNGFTFGRLHAQQEREGRRALRELRTAGKTLRRTPIGWLD